MVEKIESDKSSDEDYLSEVSVDISDDDRRISSPDLKIIENHVKNIEKCIAELKHAFDNLTNKMVLIDGNDQMKYKK